MLEKHPFPHWFNMEIFASETRENGKMRLTRGQSLLNNSAAGWPIDTGPALACSELTGVANDMSVGGLLAARAQREVLSVKNPLFSTYFGILFRIP